MDNPFISIDSSCRLLRILILYTIAHIKNLIRVPPAYGTQQQVKGNEFVNYKAMMIDLNLIGFCQFYHLIAYFGESITPYEWGLMMVFIMGTGIRFWSYYSLGKFFTFEIQVQEGQKIVKSGLYHYVAHPGYLGQFMMFVSSFLFYGLPWYLTALLLGYLVYRFHHRIREEERMLISHFGNKYLQYRRSVW